MAVVSHVPAIAQPVDQIRYRDIGVPEIMSIRGEIVEEPVARVIEDKIYVAVGKQVKESKSVLLWALKKWREKRFCIIHVHQPAQKIPVSGLGSKLPVSSVSEQEVRSYREFEKREMQKSLDEYLLICQSMRARAEKLFIESDSIEKGLVQLILQYGIKKLVMGAAADKHYKRKMVDLKSRKAISVRLQAPASCQIWFICNGNIILERNGSNVPEGTGGPSTPGSSSAAEESCDEWDDVTPTPVRRTKSSKEPQDFHNPSPPSVKDGSVDDTLYDQLEQAIAEAENSRQEAFVGAVRRGNAEKDAIEAIRRAKASESLYTEELKRRKEVEEALGKENLELERLRKQQDEVNEELQISLDQKSLLESQIAEVDQTVNELEQKIVSAVELLQNYKKEREELQIERDNALKEAEELRRSRKEASSSMHQPQFFSEFSFLEIEKATCNFDPSLTIGEGGYGSIYKGMLRHMHVAIKMLHSHSLQGPSEFQQEVDVLSKIRHPNLVTLIGACPEAWTLVYEYLCNGSLEDRLSCRDNSPPLSWQTRIHIATELCSVLTFLHSCKPHCIVHGDLKPANILLDANFVSKLSDFGICRLLSQGELSNNNTTPSCRTNPKGTFAYMDPEFLATGELTPKSDVYSFGVILLRLLTGRPALGITKEVQYALDTGKLKMLLDPLAGDWPFVQAEQLANLALRCCEMNRKGRPDLGTDVWRVLEPMRASCGGSTSFRLGSERRCQPPPYFICPIFQEVMRDPHVAADGFTYEAEALRGWLDSGHDTSPMTNHALSHKNLVPNLALRSAIQEWLQQN